MPAIPSTKKSYSAGHFDLQIDGHKSTAYLKSVDGGWTKAAVVDDPIGAQSERVKHMSTVEIEPISLEFGLTGSNDMLKWIKGSWNRQWSRRNGQITHANFDLHETYEHEFLNALVTETTFPSLDGSAKESGYLKCKIQPELVKTKKLSGDGARVSAPLSGKQKLWVPSAFRMVIDACEGMEYANKIESFTIKQGIKKVYTGAERFPQIEPTNLVFPNLTGTISLQYADKLLQWHNDYVTQGRSDHGAQRSGAIEFLSPDRKQVIFRINLYQVGLNFAAIQQATANAEQIKRVKFEMYVHKMDIDGTGLGFD